MAAVAVAVGLGIALIVSITTGGTPTVYRGVYTDEDPAPPEDGLEVIVEDGPGRYEDYGLADDWEAAVCDRVRQRSLGTGLLQGLGAAVALAAAVAVRQPGATGGPSRTERGPSVP